MLVGDRRSRNRRYCKILEQFHLCWQRLWDSGSLIIAVEYPLPGTPGKGIHSVFGDLTDIVNFGDVSGIIDIEIQSVTFFIGFVDQLRHIFPV